MSAQRRVVLHVGAPKTGTTFVQDVLFQHRAALGERGVLYPADRFDAHFLAALDLMELPWGGLEQQAVGAWERLAEQARTWDGSSVIVSHEILATASREQVRRAFDSLGAGDGGSEVHVVMSVRDLVRQIPAEWQENVKHRRTLGYRRFLDEIADPARSGTVASWFWGVQEIPAILGRWAHDLPPERVHVVTVPKPGAPRTLLWERFAEAFHLDPATLDPHSERSNPSLGVAESAFLRRVNQRVNGGVLANEHYREFVREHLAHRTLSQRREADRLRLPDDVRAWAVDLSERWIDELGAAGYSVIGSLDELRPDPPEGEPFVDPDDPPREQLEEAMMTSVVALLRRAGDFRGEVDHLHRRLQETEAERDQARREVGAVLRAKRAFVRKADDSASAGFALRVYRRVRRR